MARKPDLSIIGQKFNDLVVDRITDEYTAYNDRLYECTCLICGRKRLATKSNLKRNEIKNCGNHRNYKDISNQRFGNLKALYVTDKKSSTKSRCKVWHCICDCKNECDVPYGDLVSGNVHSCGCLKVESIKKLYVEGTAPCKLAGRKIRATNTSGTTGIWFDRTRGKWTSEIMFKHKKYYLGRYEKKEDAIMARKTAEKQIFGEFLEWYEKEYKK